MPKILKDRSFGSDTGYAHGKRAYKAKHGVEVNSIPLPSIGAAFLADASSPIPNMRPPEILLALIFLSRTSPFLVLRTFLGAGGTTEQYPLGWFVGLFPNKFWLSFYQDTKIMDRVPRKYAPASWYVYIAIFFRKLLVMLLWMPFLILNPMRFVTLLATYSVGVFEWRYRNLKLTQIRGMLKHDQVAVSIPCPICSYQQKKTVMHTIAPGFTKPTIYKDAMSKGEAKCAAATILKGKLENLTLWDLTYRLGGKISGALAYALMSEGRSSIFIRDYSRRGETVSELIKKHGKDLWITSRFYLKSGEREVTNLLGFVVRIIFTFPLWWKIFREYPLLSNGDEIEIQM